MLGKHFALVFLPAVIVVIIQTAFADGNDFLVSAFLRQLGRRHLGKLVGVVRMNPDRGIDKRIFFRQFQLLVQSVYAVAGVQCRGNAVFLHPQDNFIHILFKIVIIQMAVAVD